MNSFVEKGWQAIFEHNGLGSFDALWNLQADWFEPPNQRRGGWSGVSRIMLPSPDGSEETVFLKRQENHTRKTWRHPISREPTFRSEARNLRLLNSRGIAAPHMVYYAERKSPKGWQVILATRELKDYLPLDVLIERWYRDDWGKHREQRSKVIPRTAAVLSKLHKLRLAHNAMHAKHMFIQEQTGAACLIDLEKMRARLTRRQAMLRDLDSFNRRTARISRTDRLRFLLCYMGKPGLDDEVRAVWRRLEAMAEHKYAGRR
ncbi:MAG TPA: lipopolysaccharide kinase [Thiolapillus brandeum]|uniref:Lipopolysaccharide kinase n=1 Tax=Thiolapillus brandeum TaxID=1076588 RepID=A0A831WFP5_9GAMM|nr:lipopolysaccharide kinase [Thiolapillus brandeum]